MRRADRLFQIVQLARGRRLATGEWLAGRLEVSLRTVYRDIADLQAQGVSTITTQAAIWSWMLQPSTAMPAWSNTTGCAGVPT